MTVAFQPRPKSETWRSEAYRRLVASMPCAHCGIGGFSNACHADQGKGMGTKSDDRTCWPGCVDRPGRSGCHSLIGARGMFTREQRRIIEAKHAAATRERIKADGLWRKEWPEWSDSE